METTIVESGIALLTLTVLEIILGIDNILVISIITGRLPEEQQPRARFIGLALAMVLRIALLLGITWIMKLTTELFSVFGHGFTGKDLILIVGGLFLLFKAVLEIHKHVEGHELEATGKITADRFSWAIVQILLLDLVFSLDSVITAVGMAKELWVMIAAVIIAVIVMMIFATPISAFIGKHPTLKVLALAFLVLIAVTLIVEGMGEHMKKGYLYFAMGFSLIVELLNLRALKRYAQKKPPSMAQEDVGRRFDVSESS